MKNFVVNFILLPIIITISFIVAWISWFYWQWKEWKLYPTEEYPKCSLGYGDGEIPSIDKEWIDKLNKELTQKGK